MTNEQFVRDACRVIWSEGDLSRNSEFYADYPMKDWGTGLEGIKQLAGGLRTSLPDYCERIDELINAGDKVVVRLTIQGTQKGPIAGFSAPCCGPDSATSHRAAFPLVTWRNGPVFF